MTMCKWIPSEFFLMIHQTCASPGGRMLTKILSKMRTENAEDMQGILGLHRSPSPERISVSPNVRQSEVHPGSSRGQISGVPIVCEVQLHPSSSPERNSGSPNVPQVGPHISRSRGRTSRSRYFLRSSSRSRLRRRDIRLSAAKDAYVGSRNSYR
jgi:hypothetical protein